MNELQQLPNPDNVPGAVTTGYQRQNTNIFAIQTGIDTTEPFDNNNGIITIPAGGILDVNGVLYKIVSEINLTKSNRNTAYWIAISDNEDGSADMELVTRPGIWNSEKQSCYTADGRRTLNWVSLGELFNPPTTSIIAEHSSPTTKTVYYAQLTKGWKYAHMGSGLGGGNGGNAPNGVNQSGGSGGVPSSYIEVKKLFFCDSNMFISIRVGGNGGNGGRGGNGQNNGTAGGGGAGGEGESTSIICSSFIIETGICPAGNPGAGRDVGFGGRSGNGGRGGNGETGESRNGGVYPGGNGVDGGGGAGGGAGGAYGVDRTNGSPGGFCNIYSIMN
jgi:hypothetical protein